MNREIKFRAFDGKRMLFSENGDFYLIGQKVDIPSSTGHEFYRKEYPIMQYTGLKDKNGVGIYEGDILKGNYQLNDEEDPAFCVGFVHGAFAITHIDKDELSGNDGDLVGQLKYILDDDELPDTFAAWQFLCSELDENDYTVIGNIHQNPNLLK